MYYHMKKESSASLSVTFVDASGAPAGNSTTASATSPTGWKLLAVERTDLPSRFSIIISGKTAETGKVPADVAIDDIDVRPGRCNGVPPVTAAPPPATTTPTPSSSSLPAEQSTKGTTSTPSREESPSVAPTTESPAPPEPILTLDCPKDHFNCRDGINCIPAGLLCDGVRDCPNGIDELCGKTVSCPAGEFFCVSRTPRTCIPRSMICDGKEDCVGGSDESLCKACPPNFCLNDGVCQWTVKEPYPICKCTDGHRGHRCQALETAEPHSDEQKAKDVGSAGPLTAGLLVVTAVIVIAAVVAFVIIRRRRAAKDSPLFLNNPTYDASEERVDIS
uniref:Putative mam and ldl-receptor class a domain-containing protein n=1 Tax=Amblyomma sculptum TaxID=1581419 RepID=A0A1E1XRR0_AMBSC